MKDIAKQPKRQSVAHNIFDDRRFTTIVESMGVPPEAIGAAQLLVYELNRWVPACDTRLPAQRNPKQAKFVVNQGPFLHRDRLLREDSEAKFRWSDAL
jgi:hypothetical protein